MKERNLYKGSVMSAGIPARIYRTTTEIRRDMERITDKIKEANDRLCLRSMLLDLVDATRDEGEDPAYWIPELTAALNEARVAYDTLCELKDELSCLYEEMRETRWAIRV